MQATTARIRHSRMKGIAAQRAALHCQRSLVIIKDSELGRCLSRHVYHDTNIIAYRRM